MQVPRRRDASHLLRKNADLRARSATGAAQWVIRAGTRESHPDKLTRMKAVVQRVERAAVSVGGEVVGRIGRGLFVLLGVGHEDGEGDADLLAARIPALRIFPNEAGKFDRSLADVGGGALVVSQFTLFADTSKGRRPSFTGAAAPEIAIPLYERFVAKIAEQKIETATGRFGADMQIELVADGPVTITLDSAALRATS